MVGGNDWGRLPTMAGVEGVCLRGVASQTNVWTGTVCSRGCHRSNTTRVYSLPCCTTCACNHLERARERVDVSLTDELGEEGRKEREEQRERVGGDKTRELG